MDRLATVERSVRRRRWRFSALAGLAVACAALVLLGVPALLPVAGPGSPAQPSGPHRPGPGTCPAVLAEFPRFNGSLPRTAPGPLAPPGAVRAVMCEYDSMSPMHIPHSSGPIRQLVLTRDVDGLVRVLNELPVDEPIDPCFSRGGGGYLTLEYPDGASATIELSDMCSFARRGD